MISSPERPPPLAYDERGHGPPLVLLHAFPLNRTLFAPQLDPLSQRWRVLVPDLPGHGGSPELPTAEFTVDDLARGVLAWLDGLGVESFAVAGVSLGGYVALGLLRLAPGRLRALVMSNTRADGDDEGGRGRREAMAQLAESQGADAVADQLAPKLLGETTRRGRPELLAAVGATIRRTSVRTLAGTQRAMARRPDATAALRASSLPGRVLAGAEDEVTPPAATNQLAQALGTSPVVLERAGHLANLEQPAAWSAAVEHFLARLER
jgi:pimeloyl-ACP methyl ester carboxylesterase